MSHLNFLLVLSALLLNCDYVTAEEWRWKEKVAVVTGASAGIGAEIAVTLAGKGVTVVGLARRKELIEKLSEKTNGTIHAIKCDLLKEEDILKSFRQIEEQFGGVDILINNAGIFLLSTLVDGDTADWMHVMKLNVMAATIATREALKTMRKRGDNGQIININSIAGKQVPDEKELNVGLFPASKFALKALSRTTIFELANLGSKIKVTSIFPGYTVSSFAKDVIAKVVDATGESPAIFMEGLQVSDIAESVIFILSTKSYVQIPELTIQHVGVKMG